VAHDAGRGRFFGEGTCAAREQEFILRLVFAGKQKVGAVCVSNFAGITSAQLTILSRSEREWVLSWSGLRSLLLVKTW
jgi:hypothetical protein